MIHLRPRPGSPRRGRFRSRAGVASPSPEERRSAAAAEALADHSGHLGLDRLEELSPEAARALAKGRRQWLILPALKELPVEVAEALAGFDGVLDLGVTTLSDEAAERLAKHDGSLVLRELETISASALESLERHPKVWLPERLR